MATIVDAGLSVAMAAGWVFLGLAVLGIVYVNAAAWATWRFSANPVQPERRSEPVSILKPLCGDEPNLLRNLETFAAQDHEGAIQLVCGVAGQDDLALNAVQALRSNWRTADITPVVSAVRHGGSAKISNLVNMIGHASHPILILSDSDMVASPSYLARVLTALDRPGVGAVSVLYAGRGDAGFWSRLGAAGLSYQLLPGAIFGVVSGIAAPCMGSTIALSRSTLNRIGGIGRFGNVLADDYAIGEAIRALDLEVAIPRFVMTHASAETGFRQLWRHEVRWAATIRGVVPASYLGSIVTNPVPLAFLGLALTQDLRWGAALLCVALGSRLRLLRSIDRAVGRKTASRWMLPLRDVLTFAVFMASFFARTVEWRGMRHSVMPSGRIDQDTELAS